MSKSTPGHNNALADADLIAALLSALRVVTDALEDQRDYRLNNADPEDYAAVTLAKAAIAKAEGGKL